MATKTATNGSSPDIDDGDPGEQITLHRIGTETVQIPIVGLTPLIVHSWSAKAKRMILLKQQGKPQQKELRDPDKDYMESRYLLPDGSDGVPATAFKSAMVNACSLFGKSQITKVLAKQSLFVHGIGPDVLVKVEGEPYMREDTVRIGNGVSDLRYRACFPEWSATIEVRYVRSALSLDAVIALADAGGLGGIGEWRPSAPKSYTGTFGQFAIDDSRLSA